MAGIPLKLGTGVYIWLRWCKPGALRAYPRLQRSRADAIVMMRGHAKRQTIRQIFAEPIIVAVLNAAGLFGGVISGHAFRTNSAETSLLAREVSLLFAVSPAEASQEGKKVASWAWTISTRPVAKGRT
jgi:hypothetical protein